MIARIFLAFGLLIFFINSSWAVVVSYPAGKMPAQSANSSSAYDFTAEQSAAIAAVALELEKSAHEKAKKISAVCAILLVDGQREKPEIVGTGAYFKKQGNYGFVITSATVATKIADKLPSAYLLFAPEYSEGAEKIAISKVNIHPYFKAEEENSEGNVAIIEFKAKKIPQNIVPVLLDFNLYGDRPDYFEGAIMGYGQFGTPITSLQESGVHYAETYARLYFLGGSRKPVFRVTLPNMSNFDPEEKEDYMFTEAFPLFDNIQIKPPGKIHPHQGFFIGADHGGPLLIKYSVEDEVEGDQDIPVGDFDKQGTLKDNSEGSIHEIFMLSGIAKRTGKYNDKIHLPFVDLPDESISASYMEWEPVFIHTQWIEGVVAAKYRPVVVNASA